MKTVMIVILMISLIFLASSCSLLGNSTATGTQSEGTPLASSSQESSESISDTASGEEVANAGTVPDEAVKNIKHVKVVLFFASEDNNALKQEEREIEVTNGAILKACILALQQGPETKGLVNTIPEGTVLRGISLKDKVAIVDLSKEFDQSNSTAGIISRLSIVNTLTKISGVEKVRFHIDGEDMAGPDGQLLGDITSVALNEDGTFIPARQ